MSCRQFYVGALIVAGSMLTAPSANAAEIGFNLTEVNSTTLTSSLPGLTINNINPDLWTIDFAALGITLNGGGTNMAWVEPDSATTVNYLHQIGASTLQLDSDFALAALPAGLLCGFTLAPLAQGVTCRVGISENDTYFVTVLDLEDATVAAVPEPASMLLLGTGLSAMAARRWRNRRQRR